MTESYTGGALTALEAHPYRERVFVKIEFPSYTFRVSTMARDYTLSGELYVGAGALGSISAISESAELASNPITLTLSGLDASLMTALRDFKHQGSPITISVAFFDANDVIIPDPIVPWTGVVDTMSFRAGKTLTIVLTAEGRLPLLFRGPDGRRRNAADQEELFPGDKGLEFDGRLTEDIPWGVPTKVPQLQSGSRGLNTGGAVGASRIIR